MSYFTLVIFSWSLFQFSLNLVVTRGRSFQSVVVDGSSQELNNDFADDELAGMAAGDGTKSLAEELNTIALTRSSLNVRRKRLFCLSTRCFRFDLLDSEIWSILITLIFQDGPFLALRLTAVIEFKVRTFVTMFFTCKNAIILFLQFYRLSAICTEAANNQNDALLSNKADALASLNSAATQLDKFVLLSHAQNILIKNSLRSSNTNNNSNIINNRSGGVTSASFVDDAEKRLLSVNPILLRSNISRSYTYAIVLTPNANLNASCCNCDCHPKEHYP
jgi:hypothetical protein